MLFLLELLAVGNAFLNRSQLKLIKKIHKEFSEELVKIGNENLLKYLHSVIDEQQIVKFLDQNYFDKKFSFIEGAGLISFNKKLAHTNTRKIYKAWNINLRKSEFEGFVDFLQKNNVNNEILSKQEELKLISQFFNKFFTVNKKEKYDDIIKQAGQAMQDLALEFFKNKDYSIENGIISTKEIGDIKERKKISRQILAQKLPGSFIITQDNDDLKIHYCKRNLEISKSPIEIQSENMRFENGKYYIGNSSKPLKSMKEVMNFVKKELMQSQDCLPVPVLNQNIIDRAITGKRGLA